MPENVVHGVDDAAPSRHQFSSAFALLVDALPYRS
jgi:hypothetical protein